ncbi:Uncharacterized protein PRO82_000884 [Candidatus Protochlamydia amoebophila]|uniref:hypothetical protein n=1 Tax=Candidatus Protochlamydia amoebophila TaxID=362787 RepID=UPI001BCA4237|nr:hypothetical protein [Candidatus Protochlamydia amoebophila]MBS4163581.1 Uncharacterized protein [Candidatus Protochlamydia amoebophila]
MNFLNKWIVIVTAIAMTGLSNQQLEAVTYVTDTGGYAYDESRTATNLAPAIALGTVAIVGIIAIAVQNSHHSSSSHSSPSYSSSSSHTNTGYYSHSQ